MHYVRRFVCFVCDCSIPVPPLLYPVCQETTNRRKYRVIPCRNEARNEIERTGKEQDLLACGGVRFIFFFEFLHVASSISLLFAVEQLFCIALFWCLVQNIFSESFHHTIHTLSHGQRKGPPPPKRATTT